MRIRRYTKSRRGAGMVEYGLVVGLIAAGAIVAVQNSGDRVQGLFSTVGAELGAVKKAAIGGGVEEESQVADSVADSDASCKAILDAGNAAGDGVYTIDPDGSGPVVPFDVYCDMTSAGGGWTMVVAQFESNPVANWNEGRQSDYDPSLASAASFALSTEGLPSHTQVGFGRQHDADFIDVTTQADGFTYSTGEIPKTLVSGASGVTYHVHRNLSGNYGNHDPEEGYFPSNYDWANTLTFDRSGAAWSTWSFSPRLDWDSRNYRGYGMNGARGSTSETYAWTVWVR